MQCTLYLNKQCLGQVQHFSPTLVWRKCYNLGVDAMVPANQFYPQLLGNVTRMIQAYSTNSRALSCPRTLQRIFDSREGQANGCYILNTGGCHWTALFFEGVTRTIGYFDSCGDWV